jgi:UDP-glucose 4-epimerase
MENKQQWVLVTGGLGYIGSHVCVSLCLRGFNVIVVDILTKDINRSTRIREILAHEQCQSEICFSYKDLAREELCIPKACDYIIHLAALKSVGESVSEPLRYYENNIKALLTVLQCARRWRSKPVFIFSSSATVYGVPPTGLVTEESILAPVNPYGQTKVMCEQILRDTVTGTKSPISAAVLLRYFNPVGAHPSGVIGEDASSGAQNLMPVILQILSGERDALHIYGTDYSTPDGTALRDYIHIMDLAEAHVAACQPLVVKDGEVEAINIGRGEGVSVREMILAMERVTERTIDVVEDERRPGDAPSCFTTCHKALDLLGWKASRSLDEMCSSAAKAVGIKTVV